MVTINIGKDFSVHPIGRYFSDGAASGEAFRERVLLKAIRGLHAGEKIKIILDDGVDGYGSSFLSEAFAGVVKHGYMKSNELLDLLTFQYNDEDFEFYEMKIKEHISQAIYGSKN